MGVRMMNNNEDTDLNQVSGGYNYQDLKGELENGNINALNDAGLIGAETAEYLETIRKSFKKSDKKWPKYDNPDETAEKYYETKQYLGVLRREINKNTRKAVEKGNEAFVDLLKGNTYEGNSLDISEDTENIEILMDLFRRKPKHTDWTNRNLQMTIFSSNVPPTGRGKTSFSYYMIEVGRKVHPTAIVYTNNTSDNFRNIPGKWSDIEQELRKDGEKIVMIDEAAQIFNYNDGKGGEIVSKFLRLARKNRTHIIMISHTGKDVPRDIRRQMFFTNKLEEKDAEVGYGITDSSENDRLEISEKIVELEGIRDTLYDYESDDEGVEIEFDMDEEESEENVEMVSCKEDGCGRNTKYTSEEEAQNIVETGYCFVHDPDK